MLKEVDRLSAEIRELGSVHYRDNSLLRKLRMQRARLLGRHSKDQFHALCHEFGMRCVRCWEHVPSGLQKDHILPVYQGGSDGINNIQPLCVRCNTMKGPESFDWISFRRIEFWGQA